MLEEIEETTLEEVNVEVSSLINSFTILKQGLKPYILSLFSFLSFYN